MNNKTYENQQQKNNLQKKQHKIQLFNQIIIKSLQIISNKIQNSWKDWIDKFSQLQIQSQHQQIQNIKHKKQKTQSKNKSKIEIKRKDNKQIPSVNTPQSTFISQPIIIRKRTRSQNNNQLKSLKKTNQQIIQQQEQEKKIQRLKQINKRKLQLMDRLKKIDSQLIEVKRQGSPIYHKNNSLIFNNLQKSFGSQFNNSRLNKPNENVVEQHFKIVEKLQKINNQKIKRQEKLAEQFKKKQQIQIMKIQELENKRKIILEEKSRKNQLVISKLINDRKNKNLNYPKINQLPELGESSMIPMTLVHKTTNGQRKVSDGLFFERVDKRSSKNLLTERDGDQAANKQEQEQEQEIKKKQGIQNQFMNEIDENYNQNQIG